MLGDTDWENHKKETMKRLMDWWEKNKKDKHGGNCHDQCQKFSSFVLSVDGIIGREAQVGPANLSRLMEAKKEEPISHVCGWVTGWIEIAVAISYYWIICWNRLLSSLRDRKPYWDSGLGLGLVQYIARQNSLWSPAQNYIFSCPTSYTTPLLDRSTWARHPQMTYGDGIEA